MAVFEHLDLLREMVAKKYINVQEHPDFPLWLYNYSRRTQKNDAWNDATLACRGLILDRENHIISRPFGKFFHYSQIDPCHLPREPFTVSDKMDGSLGISYWYNGVWRIATRGSFDGKQAQRANLILQQKYARCLPKMQPEYTYLFEIIYPENKIIIDYGECEELVLLAVIHTETGEELSHVGDIGFPMLKTFEGLHSLLDVLSLNNDRAEGVVVRFESGFRLKVKFTEYTRRHKIMLGLTEINVWRQLSTGRSLDELVQTADEEYRTWLRRAGEKILADYEAMYRNCINLLQKDCSKQKQAEKQIWKMVKPDESGSWFAERG